MMLVDDPGGACEVYPDGHDDALLHHGHGDCWMQLFSELLCSIVMFMKRRKRGECIRKIVRGE